MEILFVFTHAVMLICLISIIRISIRSTTDNAETAELPVISSLTEKLRFIQINTVHISRTVTTLLTHLL